MPRPLFFALLLLCALAFSALAQVEAPEAPASLDAAARVLRLDVTGAITPAQADALDNALDRCVREGFDLLVIRLDTPGGLNQSMRRMVKAMRTAEVPVAVWVGPQGAMASSAGTFLVAASHFSGMAPLTTIGSASPVTSGGEDMSDTMGRKVTGELVSLITSIARAHGRNTEWYASAVTDAASLPAEEAVMQRVVECQAVSLGDFLAQAGTRGIEFRGEALTFGPDVEMATYEQGIRHRVLSWLLNPTVAYLLLLGGMAGLFFELTTPGAIFPGVFGGVCLLLGLYAMAVLPTSAAGLLLILLGIVFFLLEIKVTSYGMLGVAGVVSLFFGSMILFPEDAGYGSLPLGTIIATVGTVSVFLLLVVWLVARAHRRPGATGSEGMAGRTGTVRRFQDGRGVVFVHGELWSAVSPDALQPGDRVSVESVNGLELLVRKADDPYPFDADGEDSGAETP